MFGLRQPGLDIQDSCPVVWWCYFFCYIQPIILRKSNTQLQILHPTATILSLNNFQRTIKAVSNIKITAVPTGLLRYTPLTSVAVSNSHGCHRLPRSRAQEDGQSPSLPPPAPNPPGYSRACASLPSSLGITDILYNTLGWGMGVLRALISPSRCSGLHTQWIQYKSYHMLKLRMIKKHQPIMSAIEHHPKKKDLKAPTKRYA